MSRKRLAIAVALVALLATVALGEQLAGSIERWFLALHGHTQASTRPRALEDGWPNTPAGAVARGWVEAFSAGEDAMTHFLTSHLPAESLAERPMEDRLASYRALHGRLGSLMLGSVLESSDVELRAALLAEDASSHQFMFTVQKESPHKLVSVAMMQTGHGHGGH